MLKKNGKKIICVAGFSGSGKTTASKTMKRYLGNTVRINGDLFMFDAIPLLPKESEKIFGEPVDTDDGLDYLIRFTHKLTSQTTKDYIFMARPYVNKKVIETANNLALEQGIDFIIADCIALPNLDVWKQADYRVVVMPKSWEVLVKRLIQRGKETGTDVADVAVAENRRFAVEEEISIAIATNVDHIIYNNYDEQLEEDVKILCEKIKNL